MTLRVYTDAKFVPPSSPEDPKEHAVAVSDDPTQLVAAAKGWLAQMQAFAKTTPKEGLTRLLRLNTVIGVDHTPTVLNTARALITPVFPPGPSCRDAFDTAEALYHLCLHRLLLRGLDELVERNGLASPVQLDPRDRDGAVAEVLDEKEAQAGLIQVCTTTHVPLFVFYFHLSDIIDVCTAGLLAGVC